MRHPPPAARAERRGHPAPDRPQGIRQGRRGAGPRRLIEARHRHGDPRRGARPARRRRHHRQPAAPQCHDARAFSSGADRAGDLSADPALAAVVNHALLKHHLYTKPIVAAVNGDCVGGGVELLLSIDIRAAAPHARFGLPEVRWSIYPFGGAANKLVQQIGYVHAMELLPTARLIDAAEAARLGLVNRVVPADQLMPWALETAELIGMSVFDHDVAPLDVPEVT
ncbi:MAG TPA: enoyl-CoA hydratase-related protein [Egibacteraceae bacterium]|nr:enoyl-CoA hydratase-related protein [Egibacteraceae bacterium]